MRYLFSVEPEKASDEDEWAPAGEPVVPQFPHAGTDFWISTASFKNAPTAVVEERDDIDLDVYAKALAAEYPGLPLQLHEEYVLRCAKLAHMVPVGSTIQVYITQNQAKVLVRETEEWIELWNKQPLP
jgi:hypothetical protein